METDAIGLIGFPSLLDHMLSRILAEYDLRIERFDVERGAPALNKLRLAFFFWPDRGDQGYKKMRALAAGAPMRRCPIVIVANPTSALEVQPRIGNGAEGLLQTPLKPREIAETLAKYAHIEDAHVSKSLNVDYVHHLLKHTIESLEQLTGLNCERTSLEYSSEAVVTGYVSGTVGLSGTAEGHLTASFTKGLAVKIANATMASRSENATEIEISTSIAELIETIANAAKNSVPSLRENLTVSAPQVFAGGPHIVAQQRGVQVVVLKFKAAEEEFSLLIHLRVKLG